jgi:hypothetical protein
LIYYSGIAGVWCWKTIHYSSSGAGTKSLKTAEPRSPLAADYSSYKDPSLCYFGSIFETLQRIAVKFFSGIRYSLEVAYKGTLMKTLTIFDIFPGIQIMDSENVTVENPFSGETSVLTPEEVAVYDYLKGCEMIGDYTGLRKGLEWFMENNSEAYMTLLD